MTKRELRKEAHRRIIKNGATHQEAFDELQLDKSLTKEEIAEQLSKIPSKSIIERIKIWKIVYIGLMSLIIVQRIIGIFIMGTVSNMDTALLLVLILAGIVFPIVAIISVVQNKIDVLTMYSFFFVISFLRSYKQFEVLDAVTIAVIIPYIGAVVLGLWLPFKFKTPYKRIVKDEVQLDGSTKKIAHIVFEKDKVRGQNDLLDSAL